jgi:hypothetical protein
MALDLNILKNIDLSNSDNQTIDETPETVGGNLNPDILKGALEKVNKPEHSLKRDIGKFIETSKASVKSYAHSKRLNALYGPDPSVNPIAMQDPIAWEESQKAITLSRRNRAISELTTEMPGIEIPEADIQKRMVDVGQRDRAEVAEWWEELEQMEFLQPDPEYAGKSSGIIEDIAGGIGSSWLGSLSMVSPYVGSDIILHQMAGATSENLEKQGVPSERAYIAGMGSALVNLPLELAGEAVKLKFLFPNSGKWITRLLLAGETFGGEGFTEYLQKYPEKGAEIWAKNPDLNADEMTNHMADTFGSWEFQKEAAYEGLIGGLAGLATVGGVQGGIKTVDYLVTPKQQRINREKAQKFAEIISKETPTKDDAQALLRIMGIRDDVAGKMLDQVKDESVTDIIETVKSRVLHQSEPIKSIARDKIITAVKSHGNFTPEQTAAYVNIWDGIAHSLTESGDIEGPDDFYNMWSLEAGVPETDTPMFQSGQRVVQFMGYQDILKTGQPQPVFEVVDSPDQGEIGSTLTERALKERLIPVPDYKPAESFFNKVQPPDFKTMEVESKAIDESTGEILSIKENYEQALTDVDERYEKYLQLMECLKS